MWAVHVNELLMRTEFVVIVCLVSSSELDEWLTHVLGALKSLLSHLISSHLIWPHSICECAVKRPSLLWLQPIRWSQSCCLVCKLGRFTAHSQMEWGQLRRDEMRWVMWFERSLTCTNCCFCWFNQRRQFLRILGKRVHYISWGTHIVKYPVLNLFSFVHVVIGSFHLKWAIAIRVTISKCHQNLTQCSWTCL